MNVVPSPNLRRVDMVVPPTLADCDLSNQLKNTLETDINIKGSVRSPAKMDLSKIIPVYDFASKTNLTCNFFQGYYPDIGGIGTMYWRSNMSDYPSFIRNIYCHIMLDAAGRAALSATNEIIDLTVILLNPATLLEVFRYGQFSCQITASPANAGSIHFGTQLFTGMMGIVEIPNQLMIHQSSGEFIVPPRYIMQVELMIRSLAAFPFNTDLNFNIMHCSSDKDICFSQYIPP